MKNLKRIIAVLLTAVLVGAVFAACAKNEGGTETASSDYQAVLDKGTLVVGITDYEPMDYQDENGNWTGFDAELVEAVAAKLGVKVEYVVIEWDNRFTELSSGAIDVIWNGMTIDDSVKANCDVSKSYATNSQVVVMNKDVLADYPDAASMSELSIAVESGSAGEKEAKKISENVVSLATQSDAIKEVELKASQACIIDSTMANAMTADGKDFDDLGYTLALTTEEYGAGFRKGSDLVEKVNAVLDELTADGTMKTLSEKYGVNLAE